MAKDNMAKGNTKRTVAIAIVVAALVALAAGIFVAITADNVTVRFLDTDGTVISEQRVPRGGNATAPQAPHRDDAVFTAWDGAFTNVHGDSEVRAVYTQADKPAIGVNTEYTTSGSSKVEVTISLLKNSGLASLLFNVYADTGLTLENVEFREGFGDYATAPEPYSNCQTISIMSPTTTMANSGDLVKLTYAVNSEDFSISSSEAVIHLVLDEENTFTSELENVALATIDGAVKVQAS